MGEIIARAVPETPLAFTGERLTTEYAGQTEFEHLHRYLLAREWCRGKDVLDVASGEGYGTWMLAKVARSATGVEIAPNAVEHATRSYCADNLRFLQGDARDIPLEDASLDVVVSFETIEHFAEQPKFVVEVRRVLRPDGTFIVSTPDRDNYSPAETPPNPYHVQEFTLSEFEKLLQAGFANVDIVAQRPILGSVILPPDGAAVPPLCYERRGAKHFEGSRGLSRPQYYIAFASDAPLTGVTASVYIDTSRLGMHSPAEAEQALKAQRDESKALIASNEMAEQALQVQRDEIKALIASNEMAERAAVALRNEAANATAQVRAVRAELDAYRVRAASAEAELEAYRVRAASAEAELEAYRVRAASAEAQLEAYRVRVASAEGALHLVHGSTSWRLTRPLRAVGRKFFRQP